MDAKKNIEKGQEKLREVHRQMRETDDENEKARLRGISKAINLGLAVLSRNSKR